MKPLSVRLQELAGSAWTWQQMTRDDYRPPESGLRQARVATLYEAARQAARYETTSRLLDRH